MKIFRSTLKNKVNRLDSSLRAFLMGIRNFLANLLYLVYGITTLYNSYIILGTLRIWCEKQKYERKKSMQIRIHCLSKTFYKQTYHFLKPNAHGTPLTIELIKDLIAFQCFALFQLIYNSTNFTLNLLASANCQRRCLPPQIMVSVWQFTEDRRQVYTTIQTHSGI